MIWTSVKIIKKIYPDQLRKGEYKMTPPPPKGPVYFRVVQIKFWNIMDHGNYWTPAKM